MMLGNGLMMVLSFRGTFQTLQGIFNVRGDNFCAELFEKPTPPAWGEDEVSAILDTTSGRINRVAGDVWYLFES